MEPFTADGSIAAPFFAAAITGFKSQSDPILTDVELDDDTFNLAEQFKQNAVIGANGTPIYYGYDGDWTLIYADAVYRAGFTGRELTIDGTTYREYGVSYSLVAEVNGRDYFSLTAAVAALPTGNVREEVNSPALTEIKLLKDTNGGFDFGSEDGKSAVNAVLDLNGKTLTLGPAIGSAGTETNGLRVLAYSKLIVKDGVLKCSDLTAQVNDQTRKVKVGVANYGETKLEMLNSRVVSI